MRMVAALAGLLLLALNGCSVVDRRVVERWEVARTAQPGQEADPRFLAIAPVSPVIFIPGAKGSVLKKGSCEDGRTLWGSTKVAWLSRLDDLLIPLPTGDAGADDERLKQRIFPCSIVDEFEVRLFIPFPATLQHPIYKGFRQILERAGGFNRQNGSIAYFDYDWRHDTRIASVELAARLPRLRQAYYKGYFADYCRAWQKSFDLLQCRQAVAGRWPELFTRTGEVKFNVVTHSLGGLVARYLIRGLGHGEDIRHLVLLASPTEGAMFPLQVAVDGEVPLGETLLHFYDRKETRPIGISFPSLFQAFPRYAGALRLPTNASPFFELQTKLQQELGLTDQPPGLPAGWPAWAKEAADRWFSALEFGDASWALICRRDDLQPEECARRMRVHLERELLSSVLFQQTLNRGFCGAETDPVDQARRESETARVSAAHALVRHLREGAAAADVAVSPRPCGSVKENKVREEPTAVHRFVGHCDKTPTWATAVEGQGRLKFEFCETEAGGTCHDFGDQRIPRRSAQALRGHGGPPTDFLLCVEHTDIVKDPTVQDNLVRILLGDRLELAPVKRELAPFAR